MNHLTFANMATSGPKPKITKPQAKYKNIPVGKFMAPPPK